MDRKLLSVPLNTVNIHDQYWKRYINLIPEVVIPYQWDVLNDNVSNAPPSHCLQNFRIAAGEAKGERKGAIFQDSDVAKWLEAVAYSLVSKPDGELEKTADEVIELIGRAQGKDGYLNTYYTLVAPEDRWKNLTEGHELYCAGHMIEAAVAYYQATEKKVLLNIVCKFTDLIDSVFGEEENKIHGYPGHPEIELALVRLYRVTNEKRYLNLAKYFVDARGQKPNYFLEEIAREGYNNIYPEFLPYDPAYSQSHLPVRKQEFAEGHAVRATYLYSAMADLAELYDDEALLSQCEKLWDNIVERRMFVTGSIGSSGRLERFTTDYDLPNDSNYSETCASIGLALFGIRMARIKRDASYIDVVERALYNTVRAGISMEGDRYFYVNPLEVWPSVCMDHTSREHVKPTRQKWFDVACCPTNVARTFTSMSQYIYSKSKDELFVNLFIQNDATFEFDGQKVDVKMSTDFPKSGKINLKVDGKGAEFSLALRIPSYVKDFTVTVDGEPISEETPFEKGYLFIKKQWQHHNIELSFVIKPMFVYSNPKVRANEGKIAIMRGPEVYCLEEVDNGDQLASVFISPNVELFEKWEENLLGGTMVVSLVAQKLEDWDTSESFCADNLYRFKDIEVKAVPYGSWNNRGDGEMIVWLHSNI